MTKRRNFIRKSVIGATGITLGKIGFSCKSSTSSPSSVSGVRSQKNWHADQEWNNIKYGDWGGPGVMLKPGPMDSILLKDYAPKSSVVTVKTYVPKAKYPVIDCHIHTVARTPDEVKEWVRTMDEVGIDKSIILTESTGSEFNSFVNIYVKPYPDRFLLYCGLDTTDIENPDYPERVVAELIRCHNTGACGVGEIIDKGFGITGDTSHPLEKRLHPDDPRLDRLWEKCAELKMPVSLHVADHPSCWTPPDVYQERSPDFQHFILYGKDVPSYNEMLAIRNRTLEKHPTTIFIACHLGNQGNDLERLGNDLDKYPNLYVDTSARDYELGRTPRASARFLTKYQDRIVFGTDQGREKSMYQIHWRLYETTDEYIEGRVGWRYYGLDLPRSVLESIYRNNACRIFGLI